MIKVLIIFISFFFLSGHSNLKNFIFEKPKRRIERVFIHCSASDYDHHDDVSVIRKWHIEENGWSDVGYHFFITRSGKIQFGRDIERTPSSQKGHNVSTISICLHGKENYTEEQFESLRKLCFMINLVYHGNISFHGHNEVSVKSCPVFNYIKVLNLNQYGQIIGV